PIGSTRNSSVPMMKESPNFSTWSGSNPTHSGTHGCLYTSRDRPHSVEGTRVCSVLKYDGWYSCGTGRVMWGCVPRWRSAPSKSGGHNGEGCGFSDSAPHTLPPVTIRSVTGH